MARAAGAAEGSRAESADAAFAGFGAGALAFLRALGFYQDRAWFQENRAVYESELRLPLAALVADLSLVLERCGLPLSGDPRRALFRINRDIRFARDKSPYNTHVSAALTRGGAKRAPGALYLHFAPEGCLAAAGFWHPEPAELARLRGAILGDPRGFAALERALARRGLALARADALKRLPRGFERVSDARIAEALRLRSLTVHRDLPEEMVFRPALVGQIADFAAAAMPLLRFGWAALAAG